MLITLLALALLLGIFWIVNGTVELFTALSRRAMACRAWTGLTGAFSVFAGLRRPVPMPVTTSCGISIRQRRAV